MARIRTIKPEFFSHELLASKSAHARLLAIGLLTLADCEGRLRWVPMQVHAQVFPWEATVKIEVLLGELIDANYVIHYEAEGKRYVEVVNFRKHQRLSGKESGYTSRCPPPPKKSETTNDLQGESGDAEVKHPGTSQGSDGNPLGTGEHRNIGTGEQGKRGTDNLARSKHLDDADFVEAWELWKLKQSSNNGRPLDSITEQSQLYDLERFDTGEAIAMVRFSTSRTNCKNLILNGDHKASEERKPRGYAGETAKERFERMLPK